MQSQQQEEAPHFPFGNWFLPNGTWPWRDPELNNRSPYNHHGFDRDDYPIYMNGDFRADHSQRYSRRGFGSFPAHRHRNYY